MFFSPGRAQRATGATVASFNFIKDDPIFKVEEPYEYVGKIDDESLRGNIVFETHTGIPVYDLRSSMKTLTIEANGIEFWCDTALPLHRDRVQNGQPTTFLKSVKSLLLERFKAEQVIVYSDNVRQEPLPASAA